MARHVRPVTDEDRRRVRELHAEGLSRNAIGKEIGRSGRTVSRIADAEGFYRRADPRRGVDGVLYLTHEWRHDPAVARQQLTDAKLSRALRGWLGDLPVPGAPGLTGIAPEWTVVDPAAASLRLQLHEDGMTPALADNAVLDGIRLMSSLLGNQQLKIHRSCTGLLDELPGYS